MQQIETDRGYGRENYLVQLHHYALLRYNLYAFAVATDGIERLLLNVEAELCCKSDGSHHSQRVVREGDVGIARRADDAILQVVHTLEGIDQLAKAVAIEAPRHSVYGEVAAALIILQCAGLDLRLARILRVGLLACPDKLDLRAAGAHHSRSESLEYRDFAPHLASQCLGNLDAVAHDHHVDVGRWATKVVVANVAAHDVGLHAETIDNGGDSLENGILQRGDYLFHL